MENEHTNGTPVMEADSRADAESSRLVEIDLTLAEAEALKGWAIKPCKDGSLAIDDSEVKPALVKLGRAIDFARAVASVRDALDGAGLYTDGLSDSEVADLGRQISQASLNRVA